MRKLISSMVRRGLLAGFAVVLALSADANSQEQRTVLIRVTGESKFDVVYSRARTNATGAVIAGLIGAGIQAGVESNQDAARRDALRPHVSDEIWQRSFIKTFGDTLAANNFSVIWEGDKPEKNAKADIY